MSPFNERGHVQTHTHTLRQIQELILDNIRESKLVGLSDEFTSLATLSAINVGLTSLDGLPSLPSITKVTV